MAVLVLVLAGWVFLAESSPSASVGPWECSQLGELERIERGWPVRCDTAGRVFR